MVILAPDSWLLYSHVSLCPLRAWLLVDNFLDFIYQNHPVLFFKLKRTFI